MSKTLDPIQIVIKAVDQFSKTMNAPIKSVDDFKAAVGGMKGPVIAAAGAAAAAFTAAELKYAQMADEAYKASQKAGTTVETFSALAYAAGQSDVSTEELSKGLAKLSKTAYDAASGGQASIEAFKALGVNIKDTNGNLLPTEVLLKRVADSFAAHADGASKAALAQAIFGKSGTNLIPMLNEGSKGLNAMQLEAAKLGQVMSASTAKAAQELNDNIKAIQDVAFAGVMNAINKDLMPALSTVSGAFKDMAGEMLTTFKPALETLGTALSYTLKIVSSMAVAVWNNIKMIGEGIGSILAATVQAFTGDIKGSIETQKAAFRDIGDTVKKTEEDILRMWTEPTKQAEASANQQVNTFKTMASEISKEARKLSEAKEVLLNHENKYLFGALTNRSKIEKMTNVAQVKSEQEKFNDRIKLTDSALSTIASLSTAKNKEIALIGKTVGISQATVDMFVGANKALAQGGFFGIAMAAAVVAAGAANIAKISGVALAEGGVVTSPMHPLVGEAGPEAVIPLDKLDLANSRPIQNHIYLDGQEILNFLQRAQRDGRLDLGVV